MREWRWAQRHADEKGVGVSERKLHSCFLFWKVGDKLTKEKKSGTGQGSHDSSEKYYLGRRGYLSGIQEVMK